jgi:hypothetical protein
MAIVFFLATTAATVVGVFCGLETLRPPAAASYTDASLSDES